MHHYRVTYSILRDETFTSDFWRKSKKALRQELERDYSAWRVISIEEINAYKK